MEKSVERQAWIEAMEAFQPMLEAICAYLHTRDEHELADELEEAFYDVKGLLASEEYAS